MWTRVSVQADLRDASPDRQPRSVEASVSRCGVRDVRAVCRRRRSRRGPTGALRLARVPQRTGALRPAHDHPRLRRRQGQCLVVEVV